MIPDAWLDASEQRVSAYLVETPLTRDAERGIYIKWENHQITGSFKVRGAFNKVLSLPAWERARGLVAASAGNHGQGVAMAAALIGVTAEVFVPRRTSPLKIEAMRRLGALVRVVQGGYDGAERSARAYAANHEKTFISPYNDGQVIAGQATLALETLKQLSRIARSAGKPPSIACWIVPTGGGGLISGCGVVLSRQLPHVGLVGVQSEASSFAHSLFHRHTQEGVRDDPSLAEGLSGPIEADSLTIPLMRRHVDDMVLVSENQIRRAIAFAWQVYGEQIEGSGAAALAAVIENKIRERPAVVVITGGNIEPEALRAIVTQHGTDTWN